MDFGFTPEQQHLIERVNALVKERIAPRAASYDAEFAMPVEDIQISIAKAGYSPISTRSAAAWASVCTAMIR